MKVDYVAKAVAATMHSPRPQAGMEHQAGIQAEEGNYLPLPKLRAHPGPELDKFIREVHLKPEEMMAQVMDKDDIRRLLLMARPVPMQEHYIGKKGGLVDITA